MINLLWQNAFALKTGDEGTAGTILFLDETVFNAAVKEVLFGFVVFGVRQRTIDFRMLGSRAAGNVLTH